ncbi:YheU family protein [Geobacter chapellei]|uniref:YheU family protein n=2 Tax=Pelotalea chapellei TaxID=44671 RepID=A0ABS5U3E3_9BACT|nr:YheU family protein [Pelotalea chapellei]
MKEHHSMTQQRQTDYQEEGVEIPLERINPDTLRNLISEFVTREWEELGAVSYTLDQKIEQVLRQLREKRARVVFDATSGTCNIVECR